MIYFSVIIYTQNAHSLLVCKKIGPIIIINLMDGRIVHVYIYYIITVRVPDLPILTF